LHLIDGNTKFNEETIVNSSRVEEKDLVIDPGKNKKKEMQRNAEEGTGRKSHEGKRD